MTFSSDDQLQLPDNPNEEIPDDQLPVDSTETDINLIHTLRQSDLNGIETELALKLVSLSETYAEEYFQGADDVTSVIAPLLVTLIQTKKVLAFLDTPTGQVFELECEQLRYEAEQQKDIVRGFTTTEELLDYDPSIDWTYEGLTSLTTEDSSAI